MPFQSKSQMKAAFGGHLGKEMQAKAHSWAKETPDIKHLPEHKGPSRSKSALDGLRKAKPKEK